MKMIILGRQDGFTIIEVMVGAIVFLAGFSLLVFMLNVALTKFSVKDITTATHIGQRFMEESYACRDTVSVDTVIIVSEVSFRVKKEVKLEAGLAAITVSVKREKSDRELGRFYGEYEVE